MKVKKLLSLASLVVSSFGLLACGEVSASTSVSTSVTPEEEADGIFDTLGPIYKDYRTDGINKDTSLYSSVAEYPDTTISYSIATDVAEDKYGNQFDNEQDYVTIGSDGASLVIADDVPQTDIYINLRASVTIDGQTFTHDYTVLAKLSLILKSIAAVKASYLAANPTPSENEMDVYFQGTVVSADYSTRYKYGYYYVADDDGNGMYVYRGKPTDADKVVTGSVVTVQGTVTSNYGFEVTTGATVEYVSDSTTDVTPIALDETNWDTYGSDYTSYGDWVTATITLEDDVALVAYSGGGYEALGVKAKLGNTEITWYINYYTNDYDSYYNPIIDADLKAGDTITLTTPLTFHNTDAQLGWALNSTIVKD